MSTPASIWFHIGYAFESLQSARPASRSRKAEPRRRGGAARRSVSRRRGADESATPPARRRRNATASAERPDDDGSAGASTFLLQGAAEAIRAFGREHDGRDRPARPLSGALGGAAAGAVAALLVDILPRLVLRERAEDVLGDAGDAMLEGAGRGSLYGTVLAPLAWSHPILGGLAFGTAEWALSRGGWGELLEIVQRRQAPFLLNKLPVRGSPARSALEHALFGLIVALLYRPRPARSGITPDD